MKQLFSLFFVSLWLQGCATYNVQSTRLSNNQPLPAEHGVVAVQVVNNTGRLAPLHAGWTEIIAVRVDNREQLKQAAIDKARAKAEAKGKEKEFDPEKVDWDPEVYSFSPNSQGVVDSQLFAGSMPQGEYLISSLYSFYTDGNMSSWLTMPVFGSAGTFEVKAGHFTNLGSLVFQPLLNIKEASFWSNSSSQKAYVTRISEPENLQDFIIEHFPQLANSVDFSQPLGWQTDELSEPREKLSALSRNNAYGDKALLLSGTGQRAIVSKFGQLHVLDAQGDWQHMDLPTNSQLTSALQLDNTLLVGAERGQVFVRNDSQSPWRVTQPVSAREAIVWLGEASDSVYAVTASANQHLVYRVNQNNGSWVKIGEFERKNPNDFWVQNGGLFPILTKRGELRILNDNKLYDFDQTSQSWQSIKASPMVSVDQLANGVLVGLEVSQWDGVGDQVVSFDYGQSWLTLSRKLKLFGDHGTDRSLPFVLDDGTLVSLGRPDKKVKKLQIMSVKAQDKVSGSDWKMEGVAKANCQIAMPKLTFENRIYFLCDQGQIVSTRDFGQTWQTEVAMDIAAMQDEFDGLLESLKAKSQKQAEEAQQSQQSGNDQ